MTGRFLYWRHTVLWDPPELLYTTQTRFRPFSPISCKQRRFHLFNASIFNQQWMMTSGTEIKKKKKIRQHSNAKIYSNFHVHIPDGGSSLHIRPQGGSHFTEAHPTAQPMLVSRQKEIVFKCLQQRGDSLLHLQTYVVQIAGQPGAS
jgi:hypothetical protein